MSDGSEEIRLKQAEFLSALFEQENNHSAKDAAEMDAWIKGKSKVERDDIRRRMEDFLLASSAKENGAELA
ncbi:MAG TPA: hypothetical protein VMX35_16580 [Acidobacteriota bacterium]|nr:hypothetical protein [Acidobacteriota bacterium]